MPALFISNLYRLPLTVGFPRAAAYLRGRDQAAERTPLHHLTYLAAAGGNRRAQFIIGYTPWFARLFPKPFGLAPAAHQCLTSPTIANSGMT